MQYVDQSASGLRFFLASSDVDVESLEVIDSTSFAWSGCRINMGILGASHFLKVEFGDGSNLSEVFACTDMDLEGSHLKSAPFADLPAHISVPLQSHEYSFIPRLLKWDEGAYELSLMRQAVSDAPTGNQTIGLEYQFPTEGNDCSKLPLTVLLMQLGEGLILKTAHCYPNEEQIVFTATTLRRKSW